MATLQKLILNGSETGATAGAKINALVDAVNAINLAFDNTGSLSGQVFQNSLDIDSIQTTLSQINTNLTAINQAVSGVTTGAGAAVAEVEELKQSKSMMRVALPQTQGFLLTATYQRLNLGVLETDLGNGNLSYNPSTNAITVNRSGIYMLSLNRTLTGTPDGIATLTLYLNGVDTFPTYGWAQLTTVYETVRVSHSVADIFELAAGDTLELYAKAGVNDTISVYGGSFSIAAISTGLSSRI